MNRARHRADKPPAQCAVSPLEVADSRKSVRATPAPRLRTLDRARLDAQELLDRASSTRAQRRCPCREDMRASERHLATGRPIARGGGEVVIDANLLEGMRLEELPVRVAEMQALSSEPLEFPMRDEHGNGLASARQFDFDTSLRLVHDAGKTGPSLCDGIPLGHIMNVHLDVHGCK
jgi:hypothetical protein